MTIADLITDIGSQLGYTISASSKPTTTEMTAFLHEGLREIANHGDADQIDEMVNTGSDTIGSGEITKPSDTLRITSVSISGSPVPIYDSSMYDYVASGLWLFPDICAFVFDDAIKFLPDTTSGTADYIFISSDVVNDFINLSDTSRGALVNYGIYKAKMQDEESEDAVQFLNRFKEAVGITKKDGN